jgi:hypothetical protein
LPAGKHNLSAIAWHRKRWYFNLSIRLVYALVIPCSALWICLLFDEKKLTPKAGLLLPYKLTALDRKPPE